MPRNGSGVMSKPAGTTFVPNTTIESAKVNSLADDIISDLNAARPITAGGTGATSVSAARTALAVPGTATVNTFTATQKWAKGADVASAAALTLGDDGNYFDITGTTAITSITTKGAGTVIKLHFDAALTLAHHATDLILPGGANITTAAGDEAEFVEYATGDWRCTVYTRASGIPLIQTTLAGHINGLTLSNNVTDATNDIDIAAGEAASAETNPVLMVLASALTKRLDAAWAVGTNQGGLDTGSIADTTYHVWLIQRSDTGVVDALFSASATSPTMPADYDRKACIGSVIRKSGALVPFIQLGNIFTINAVNDISATNPGTSAVTRAITAPVGVKVISFGSLTLFGPNNGTSYAALLTSLDLGDQTPSTSNAQVSFTSSASSNRQAGAFQVPTNTSAQIRSRLATSDASVALTITTRGWIDPRL